MTNERPTFRAARKESVPGSPEELFYQLAGRASSHGYLRGPQQDVLRDYVATSVDAPDVALELPTGTGKSAVGLLIADWRRRRSGNPVAYLALTNQLAHQALQEASNLGVPAADLTGSKYDREAAEVGRYRTADAVAVSTYSNLFNVNPVVTASNVIVLDDVHSGGQYVADMWTVKVERRLDADLYDSMLVALRPTLTETQFRRLEDPSSYQSVELCDLLGHAASLARITSLLDASTSEGVRYKWPLIRNEMHGCVVLVSALNVVIRPPFAPTFRHAPFVETDQRIYMTATLGSEDDLKREYGITTVQTLRAEHPQWGRRYIFVPGLNCSAEEALDVDLPPEN